MGTSMLAAASLSSLPAVHRPSSAFASTAPLLRCALSSLQQHSSQGLDPETLKEHRETTGVATRVSVPETIAKVKYNRDFKRPWFTFRSPELDLGHTHRQLQILNTTQTPQQPP